MQGSFRADNTAYEKWLRNQCDVVKADLDYKHERMEKNPFVFLRATYFRWACRIAAICPDLARAPVALAVGDTHVENFGTWRDADGRLVWGVNDFDEAAMMPALFDLVRLAASVRLSPKIAIPDSTCAAAILAGYREGLAQPHPTLLDEHEPVRWLRPLVACTDEDRLAFWTEIAGYPKARPPARVVRDLARSLPAGASGLRFATRVKGGGGLGRPRYVVIADWRGGTAVREAKALVASAWHWAHGDAAGKSRFLELANGRHRAPDPFLDVRHGFVVRRIAADSRKVELGRNAGAKLKARLLGAMGRELGSIHAARSGAADRIRRDLDARPRSWLYDAAKTAAAAVAEDYAEWVRFRAGQRRHSR